MLHDRRNECAALERLLHRIRAGQSAVLVLRGEAGIGKTALLEFVAARATGCRVARAVGVQAEMELAFAGLHHLCAPMLDRIDALPAPQQEALQVAFGLQEGSPPDRFLVALAALSLLAEAAETRPLVCLVEDAHWLDRASAQVLAFVARRLLAERIAVVFAVREPSAADELAGLPELRVEGLPDPDARALLESAVPGLVDARVRERILAETRGNPLALLELPRGLTPGEPAGGLARADARPLASRIEHSFHDRVQALPRDTQRLLLTAAAEPLGDSSLLWRAAERLGIGGDAGWPAEAAGLIELGVRVRFAHPLVRSAIYRAAAPGDRRDAHRALAEATDPDFDPDRRAWHRAHATARPDEAVAAEMARSAGRAQGRGGLAAAAAFLQRAAELTPDPARRVDRALDAAQAKLDVADPGAAEELVSAARLGPLDELQRARVERLGAQIVFARGAGATRRRCCSRRPGGSIPWMARWPARPTSRRSRRRCSPGGSAPARTRARWPRRRAHRAGRERRAAADALLDALVTRFTEGYAASVAPLSGALRAFRDVDGDGEQRRWLWLACRLSQDLWDDELWHVLATRGVRVARDTGALSLLPVMANYLAAFNVHSGAFASAAALAEEVDAITHATGIPPLKYAALCWPRRAATTRRLQAISRRVAERRWSAARARHSACPVADRLAAQRPRPLRRGARRRAAGMRARGRASRTAGRSVELIEAGVRSGRSDEAAAALERLSEAHAGERHRMGARNRSALPCAWCATTSPSIASRSSGSGAAARRSSSRAAGSCTASGCGARTGAWRRVSCCARAHADFSRFGAEAFAERARRELLATGETVRKLTRRHARLPDAPGGPGRAAGPRRAHQPGDRRAAVHQPAHGRVPPAQGLPQARRQHPQGAARRARGAVRLTPGAALRSPHDLLTGSRPPEPVRPAAVAAPSRRAAPASERVGRAPPPGPWSRPGFPWSRPRASVWPTRSAFEDHGAPASEMLAAAARIARGVEAPVTVDAEAGYGLEPAALVDALRDAGAAGCNLEDTDHAADRLRDTDRQAEWLSAVRRAAADAGYGLVINARVDVFFGPMLAGAGPGTQQELVPEALRRAQAYIEAGVDCVYPIGLWEAGALRSFMSEVTAPVNVARLPQAPSLDELAELGVARVSWGPFLYFGAMAHFKDQLASLQ